MRLRSDLIALVAVAVLARNGTAQAATAPNAAGVWRGTSLCLVRPSSCHDEVVVFNTGAEQKYLEVVRLDLPRVDRTKPVDYARLG